MHQGGLFHLASGELLDSNAQSEPRFESGVGVVFPFGSPDKVCGEFPQQR